MYNYDTNCYGYIRQYYICFICFRLYHYKFRQVGAELSIFDRSKLFVIRYSVRCTFLTLSRRISVKKRLFGAAIIKRFYGLIVNATLCWEHLARTPCILHIASSVIHLLPVLNMSLKRRHFCTNEDVKTATKEQSVCRTSETNFFKMTFKIC